MIATTNRLAFAGPTVLAAMAGVAIWASPPSNAAECGPGTVYDAPSNMCVVPSATPAEWNAPPPAAPPPPPLPPISICPPIPFVAVCFPVN